MDNTIDMAREAGKNISPDHGLGPFLKRFEALVRADEREIERETCAKVVDVKIEEVRLYTNEYHLMQVAAAIRTRKNT